MSGIPTAGNLALELSPEQQEALVLICRFWLMFVHPDDGKNPSALYVARDLLRLIEGEAT